LRISVSLSTRIAPLRQGGDLVRELDGAAERVVGDLVDEADAQRLLGVDGAAGDDELHRLGEADDERQADGEAVAGDDVPPPLQRAEDRARRRDADVGEQRRLEPRGDGPAVHRGDHRLEDVDAAGVAADAGQRVEVAAELVVVRPRPLGRVGQVPSGAERVAGARDDEDERVVVVAEALPRVVQLLVHPAADRVALRGPVVGEDHHMAVRVVPEGLVAMSSGHGESLGS
jgi:hypothetical protein